MRNALWQSMQIAPALLASGITAAERLPFLKKFRTLGHWWAINYGVPFAKADSASCHGGRRRTNIDSKTNGRTSTQPAANKPSLAKIGGWYASNPLPVLAISCPPITTL